MHEPAELTASTGHPGVSLELRWSRPRTDPVTVHALRLTERLGTPYRCRIEIVAQSLPVDGWLGLRATAEIHHAGLTARRIHGIVARSKHIGLTPAGHRIGIDIVPALWLQRQRVDYRIFQDQDVTAIVDTLLREGERLDGGSHRWILRQKPRVREYCVQFGESNLAFITRLLDEEGIAYGFDHTGDEESMVLLDGPGVAVAPERVIPVLPHGGLIRDRESVWKLERLDRMVCTSVQLEDYNPDHPRVVEGMRPVGPVGASTDRTVRVVPGRFVEVGNTSRDVRTLGRARARTLGEGLKATGTLYRGESDVADMTVGQKIAVDNPVDDAGRTELLVTRVEHKAQGGADGAYTNTFEAIPGGRDGARAWPKRRVKRSMVPGPQTARVVSTTGEAVDVDAQRRVLVRFRWDLRQGVARPTCRVRVAQALAGDGWGTVFTPREGMEVVVQFLDGDPDRPLVTGCVYNGENLPPHDAMAEATKTTIRTSSVPGGLRHHELTFDDAAEHPEVYLHAAGQLREQVDGDQKVDIGGNLQETLQRSVHRVVLGSTLQLTQGTAWSAVEGSSYARFGRMESIARPGDDPSAPAPVGAFDIDCGRATLMAQGYVTLQGRGDSDGTNPKYGQLTLGGASPWVNSLTCGDATIQQGDQANELSVGRSKLHMASDRVDLRIEAGDSGEVIQFVAGGASITLSGSRIVLSTGKGASLVLDGNRVALSGHEVSVDSGGPLHVHSDGELSLRGAPVLINC